jgi:periplasmic divalent cation tolerance protein
MAFVYITCKDKKEAKKVSNHLLKKKLVACTNIFPIESNYWWKGKIVNDKEYAILAKTITSNYSKIKIEVRKIHSYIIPCICLLESKANKEYGRWVNDCVKKR